MHIRPVAGYPELKGKRSEILVEQIEDWQRPDFKEMIVAIIGHMSMQQPGA